MDRRHLAIACVLASVIVGPLLGGGARAADLSSPSTFLALARQAEAGLRDDRAAELYRQAHEAHPFDPAPLTALGRLAVRIGAAVEAVEYFEAALAIERRDRDARLGLADAFVELDRGDEALSVYEALLAEDAGDGRAWNGKGLALDLAGRYDEAQAAYRAGLAVAPDDREIRANLDLSQTLAAAPAEPSAAADGVTLALNAGDTGAAVEPAARTHSVAREP